jgi:hypothetical protein|tara:strand:+ start:2226 stop:2621 length:396 start_codon:yes stop_codon:yes gene_type:complete
MSDTEEAPKKKRGNPNFHKGMKALNPEGRPKGSLNKYTKISRELMSSKGPEIVNKVIEMALEGDRHCLKMCMDRIIPTSKAVEITHEHQDLGVNIIIEGVKAVEAKEAKEQEVFEAEFEEVKWGEPTVDME